MIEVHEDAALKALLAAGGALANVVIRGLDLRSSAAELVSRGPKGAVLFGCHVAPADLAALVAAGALVFPDLPDLPYEPWRATLYTPAELFAGFDAADPCTYCDSLDARVYRSASLLESRGWWSQPAGT